MKAGFIGLGKMGAGMASRLCQAGYELTVYNRSRERLKNMPLTNFPRTKNSLSINDGGQNQRTRVSCY